MPFTKAISPSDHYQETLVGGLFDKKAYTTDEAYEHGTVVSSESLDK